MKRRRTINNPQRAKKNELANHEVVVLAAYLSGAQRIAADTEDIAVKASELAPERFSWRKYPDQINIDTVRKRLWDASKAEKGAYLIGTEKSGWRLTKAGFDFARRKIRSVKSGNLQKQRKSKTESVAQSREIQRMLNEEAFLKFAKGLKTEITKSDAERFFRIDDYVTGSSRAAKLERFKIIASKKKDLSLAVEFLSEFVRES